MHAIWDVNTLAAGSTPTQDRLIDLFVWYGSQPVKNEILILADEKKLCFRSSTSCDIVPFQIQ